MKALGKHILVEFFECDSRVLNDVAFIRKSMIEATEKCGATMVTENFHHFNPYGVSGVIIIAESHLTIHTWPEYKYAAVDLFTCGETVDPWIAFDVLKESLKSKKYEYYELQRGLINISKKLVLTKPVQAIY